MTGDLAMKRRSYIIWIIFGISFIFHILISDFPKTMLVYSDELRYISIARSIREGLIRVHNLPSDYQKILYSICIAPALAFRSPSMQVRAVSWLNSLYVSSAVFPVYLLASKICSKHRQALIVALFAGFGPATMLSMTYMSEVVFIPLSLWLMVIAYTLIMERKLSKKVAKACAFGVLCYLSYLNKEIALYFLISFILVTSVKAFKDKENRKQEVISVFVVLLVFLVCFVIAKSTLFKGMGNSYNQMGIRELLNYEHIRFMAYAFICDSFFAVLAFGIFPVVIVVHDMFFERNSVNYFRSFVVLSWMIGVITIVYTITVREDFGAADLRQHIRYLEPLMYLFLAFWISAFDSVAGIKQKARWPFLTVLFLAFIPMIGRVGAGAPVDNQSLQYYNYLIDRINRFTGHEYGLLIIKCSIAILIVIWWLWTIKAKESSKIGFIILFICIGLGNNWITYCNLHKLYSISKNEQYEMEQFAEQIRSLSGNILHISPHGLEHDNRMIDTYIDRDIYVTCLEDSKMEEVCQDGVIDLEHEMVYSEFPGIGYSDLKQVNYIVADDSITLKNVQKVDGQWAGLNLYVNLDPDKIIVCQ